MDRSPRRYDLKCFEHLERVVLVADMIVDYRKIAVIDDLKPSFYAGESLYGTNGILYFVSRSTNRS